MGDGPGVVKGMFSRIFLIPVAKILLIYGEGGSTVMGREIEGLIALGDLKAPQLQTN